MIFIFIFNVKLKSLELPFPSYDMSDAPEITNKGNPLLQALVIPK